MGFWEWLGRVLETDQPLHTSHGVSQSCKGDNSESDDKDEPWCGEDGRDSAWYD